MRAEIVGYEGVVVILNCTDYENILILKTKILYNGCF